MSDRSASDLFAGFLARVEHGEKPDIDALVAAHPERAAELRHLHAAWKAVAPAFDKVRGDSYARAGKSAGSLAEQVRERFGSGVDPEVTLHGSGERAESFAADVVARLSGRAGSFGRYQVKGEIARGGMGVILRIWDEDLCRHLAMKVILGQIEPRPSSAVDRTPDGGAHSPARAMNESPPIDTGKLARFLEEAQVTGQLDHPGIVPVHELGLDPEGRVYFTMKLVKGETLKEVFDHVPAGVEGWSQTKALGVLLKVCEAMAYAHDKGVIHRDLKPGNVMVGKFGEVHVMDWGLARILGKDDAKDIRIRKETARETSSLRTERDEHRGETPESPLYTMDGDVVGTPAYMPLEQAAGKVDEVGPHSDVYALGAMLYHLLAGHMPYVPSGARLNNYAIWALVQQSPPTPIAKLAPTTPAELVAICEKAMAREWAQRYRNMSELAADLSAYLEHRVVGAYQTGAWAETKKWVERNKALAASVASGVLALVAGLIVSVSLTKKNGELFVLAEERRVRAEDNERTAKTNEQTAKREKANVLRLSAFQTLDDLTKEADELWPAEPDMVERDRAWLDKAEKLAAKIPGFRASLAEIEKRALPQSDGERSAERASHPRVQELETKRAELQWMSRMLGKAPWPSEAEVEASLAKEALPADAKALNELAWPLVDPDKPVYGSEVRALLLARRAVALASTDAERAELRDTHAWALFKLGRFDESLAEERRALEESGEAKRKEYEGYVKKLESAVKGWRTPSGDVHETRTKEWTSLTAADSALDRELSARRDWRFTDEDDRWWHAQMEKLISALSGFADEKTGLMHGTSAEHGWGLAKRMDFAASIQERSVSGPDAVKRWSEAIEAIAKSEKYRGSKWPSGVRLTAQLGLLPIGADPESGLWEFAHLQSGEPAERSADGKLVLKSEMGLVLVLIPGSSFWMGARSTDPTEQNYDPQAGGDESPVHELTLAPYFLSKYEMTQGQWERTAGGNPSNFGPSNYFTDWNRAGKPWSALHPVDNVSWMDCTSLMKRMSLFLPTEAQWEHGCRAGTSTVYWSGDEAETLREVGNVADAYAKAHGGGGWSVIWSAWDDGNTGHAEVGSYRANAFGLHDTHGNEFEWCRDVYGSYALPTREGDGERLVSGARNRVLRGGSFDDAPSSARSANRFDTPPENRYGGIGLRPAMGIATH